MKLKVLSLFIVIILTVASLSTASSIPLHEMNTVQKNVDITSIQYTQSLDTLSYTFTFPEPRFSETKIDDTVFTEIELPGCLFTAGNGTPLLPIFSVKVALPPGTDVEDIVVDGERVEVNTATKGINLKKNPILPGQPPVSYTSLSSAGLVMDNSIYTSLELFPQRSYHAAGVGECSGVLIDMINLFPVQYIPGNGQLFYFPSLTVEIKLLQKTHQFSSFYRNLPADKIRVKNLVCNPEIVDLYDEGYVGSPLFNDGLCPPSEHYEYVLITNEHLNNTVGYPYSWFDLLAHRSTYSGLNTTKVTVEMIDRCPAYWNDTEVFNDSAAHVREFIKDAYQNWGTQYVLLGGDWDTDNPENQIVPARMFTVWEAAVYQDPYASMPCDLYFSNLNGDWRDTEHGVWGGGRNSGVNDYFAEMCVGRLTVDSAEQVSTIVKKIIWYDLSNDREFLQKAVFFGGNLGMPGVTSADIMEELRNGNDPNFYRCTGFKEWNEEHPMFQFNISERRYYDWGADIPNDYKTLINSDNACIINHLSHGNPTHALDMDIPELENLTNSKFFFAYSQQCLSGRFTESNDTTEKILMCTSEDAGAFALVFNSGYGIGNLFTTNGSSQFLHRFFWDYLFGVADDMSQWRLGAAQCYSKDQISAYIDNGDGDSPDWTYTWVYVFYSSQLFGDPAQLLRLNHPGNNVGVQSLNFPDHMKSNETLSLNATVINDGRYDETDVRVHFLVNGSEVQNKTIPFFKSGTIQSVSFTWIRPSAGVYNVTINITLPTVVEDEYRDNNKSKTVRVGVWNINSSALFDSIQEAIDDTSTRDGHWILVPDGIYPEHVKINKNISLLGNNPKTTIIKGTLPSNSSVKKINNSILLIKKTNYVRISGLTITNGFKGILIASSTNTVITDCEIVNNRYGMYVTGDSEDVLIYHNNFIKNIQNAYDSTSGNRWDNGYYVSDDIHLCGGNFWDDYLGRDRLKGPSQNLSFGSDGIGDTSYRIPGGASEVDTYPLMKPWMGHILPGTVYVDANAEEGGNGTISHPFRQIQDGVDTTTVNGDTVFVFNGTYLENIVVDKPIFLLGRDTNNTIIQSQLYWAPTVQVASKNVSIRRFCLQNGPQGILIGAYSNVTISENLISGNSDGIWMGGSSYCQIIGNNIMNNYNAGIVMDKDFLDNNPSTCNLIMGNTISNNYQYGILLSETISDVIIKNIFTSNGININGNKLDYWNTHRIENNSANGKPIRYYKNIDGRNIPSGTIHAGAAQIILANSTHFSIQHGNFSDVDFGIQIGYSSFNTISGNTINANSRDGIILFCSLYNTLSRNTITHHNNGIFLTCSSHNTLNENNVTDNQGGIYLDSSSNNQITSNVIERNNPGVGVKLSHSHYNTLGRNKISDNRGGILLQYSHYNQITSNSILYSLRNADGLCLFASCHNILVQNILSKHRLGIFLNSYADNNTIMRNVITNNSDIGIQLEGSGWNNITCNRVVNNSCGIGLGGDMPYGYSNTGAEANVISENTITNNTLGASIRVSIEYLFCNNNFLYHNNFINNTLQAYDECYNFWDNGYPAGGNYWSDYNGTDVNPPDGIGDTPYNITGRIPPNIDRYPFMKPSGWTSISTI